MKAVFVKEISVEYSRYIIQLVTCNNGYEINTKDTTAESLSL